MTDPRLTVVVAAMVAELTCMDECAQEHAETAVAALDAYDDARPLEALAAYRERVERDVRARVAAEIEAIRRRDVPPPEAQAWLIRVRDEIEQGA